MPDSSPVKQKQLAMVDDELPADPWNWSAQWLYMYLEQTAIFEVDYEMETEEAKKSAELWVQNEHRDERESSA